MDIKYQIFVSSTFADLKEERQSFIRAIMELDCIPAGMELFPAADEDQFNFIKSIIDDCDYYLIIIGGRYGSIDKEGVSYTEKEYDYAVEKGMHVIALVHEDPESLALSKSEADRDSRQKLDEFRGRVCSGRLVKFWKNGEVLPGLVALSLARAFKVHPAVGWIRADRVTSNDTLAEINEIRKENERLKSKIDESTSSNIFVLENLASI